MTKGAVKHDKGKPPLDLLPIEPQWEVARVLAHGAEKYTVRGECTCYASITTTPQEESEAASVSPATSGSAGSKKTSGIHEHESTCGIHNIIRPGQNNWRRGMAWSRMFAASRRHLDQFWSGQDLDDESGLSHLAHAICDLMFLCWYWEKGVGTDDRYKADDE